MASGILAPEGWEKWKDNPIDAMARAATNVGPIIGGIAEGAGGNALGEGGPRGVPPEGTVPGEAPAAPPQEQPAVPKAKNPFAKTSLFDMDEFEDWLQNKRKAGIPYDPTPQSPNNAKGEWPVPPKATPPAAPGADPASPTGREISPNAKTGYGQTTPDLPGAPGKTQPGLQPFSPGDTMEQDAPWALDPYRPIN